MPKVKAYKAVLVPETPEMINGMVLSRQFRKLLAQLATQHITELNEQRSQLAAQYGLDIASPSKQSINPTSPQSTNSLDLPSPTKLANGHHHNHHLVHPDLPGQTQGSASDDKEEDFTIPRPPPEVKAIAPPKGVSPAGGNKRKSLMAIDDPKDTEEEEQLMVTRTASKRPQVQKNLYQRIGDWLSGDTFEIVIGALILLNIVVMMCQVQFDGIEIGNQISFKGYPRPASEEWPGAEDALYWLDVAFTLLFTADVVLRIIFLNVKFFMIPLNWIDIVVVAISLLALVLTSMANPSYVRMLRLVKLGRGLRALGSSPAVQSLQLLIKCLASSLHTLAWSLCVIFIIQCIAAMLLANLLSSFMKDEDIDVETRKVVFRYYGTCTKTMMTMFEILYANWIPACRMLIDNLGEGWALFFVLYRCLIGWAVLSVVNAVFVQSTMKVAQHDQEILIAQKQRAQEATAKNLRSLFLEIDTSGDGNLSWDELIAVLDVPKTKLLMSALEIDPKSLKQLFTLLDDGDGEISVDEFMGGIGRVKGPAKAIDMATVMKNIDTMLNNVDRLDQKIETLSRTSMLQ
eukprot:TRINITY_DN20659_c0_g1_i1.p1 TRINITY_DN20659_c0_g1~~TRINITY_DN20659_c0_g1_i1.p1  ORF type:complete len:573 (+),score=101.06 TRINITY_DN20659_c0_g1_i1:117-1835(+)